MTKSPAAGEGKAEQALDSVREVAACEALRVLVVDDDENTRRYLCEALTGVGCEATAVAGGDEAIKLYRSERFSLVIVDIFMPDKDGFETIMEIRRSFSGAKLIAMSGRTEFRGIDLLQWTRKLGAAYALTKPFSPDQLLVAMAEVLKRGDA